MKTPDTQSMCQALAQAWELLRTGQAQLPLPVNVLILPFTELRGRPIHQKEPPDGSGGQEAFARKHYHGPLGHFARSRWSQPQGDIHEVAVHPGLFGNAEDVLLVLLHEAAHCLLLDDNGGCSADGYYHRREYRDQCLQMGLRCEFTNTRHGWNNTRWPKNGMPACYGEALEILHTQLTLVAVEPVYVPDRAGNPLPRSGRVPLACGCRHPRYIYAARGVAQIGHIRCDLCGDLFVPVKAKEAEE